MDEKIYDIRLEYNESSGQFHEDIYHDGISRNVPNTYGWRTVADHVSDKDVSKFCYALDNIKAKRVFPERALPFNDVCAYWYMFSAALKTLQELINEAKELNPERFE